MTVPTKQGSTGKQNHGPACLQNVQRLLCPQWCSVEMIRSQPPTSFRVIGATTFDQTNSLRSSWALPFWSFWYF